MAWRRGLAYWNKPLLAAFLLAESLAAGPGWSQELEPLTPLPMASPSDVSQTVPSEGESGDLLEAGRRAYADGLYTDAVEFLLKALKDHPQAEVYYYLGLTYYKLMTYSLAIDAFASALLLYGQDPPPNLLFSLALSYYYGHDLERAQDYLNQVLNHPKSTPELKQLAEAQLLLTLRDQSRSYQQGMAAFQAGNFEDAQKAFRELLKIVPDSAEIHYYLGLSAYQLLEFDQARKSLKRVIELDPESEFADSAIQTLEVIGKLEQNLDRKAFFGSITLGPKGDSNVNYGDSGNNRVVSTQSESALQDLGSILNVNLNYSFDAITSLRYNYLLNLYWGLNDSPERQLHSYDFNYQQHQLTFFHRIPVLDWIDLSLDTHTSLDLLAGELYQAEAAFRPTLTFYETERLITRSFIELATERYPSFSERDNFNYAFGLDQFVYLWNSQSWLRFGYRFNHVLANDNLSTQLQEQNGRFTELEFRYANSRSDNQISLGMGAPLGPVQMEVGTLFDFSQYNQTDVYRPYQININPLTGLPLPRQELKDQSVEKLREDTRLTFYVNLEWPFAEHWKLLGRYNRITNLSNISPREFHTLTSRSYLKDQVDLSVRWEF